MAGMILMGVKDLQLEAIRELRENVAGRDRALHKLHGERDKLERIIRDLTAENNALRARNAALESLTPERGG